MHQPQKGSRSALPGCPGVSHKQAHHLGFLGKQMDWNRWLVQYFACAPSVSKHLIDICLNMHSAVENKQDHGIRDRPTPQYSSPLELSTTDQHVQKDHLRIQIWTYSQKLVSKNHVHISIPKLEQLTQGHQGPMLQFQNPPRTSGVGSLILNTVSI